MDTPDRLRPMFGPRITTPEPVLAKLEISACQELNEQGETIIAAIGGATHARGRGVKAVLGVFGRLGSITASSGPITTPEPVLAKLANCGGQEQLNERGGIVVAAIRGATHAHGRAQYVANKELQHSRGSPRVEAPCRADHQKDGQAMRKMRVS